MSGDRPSRKVLSWVGSCVVVWLSHRTGKSLVRESFWWVIFESRKVVRTMDLLVKVERVAD